MEGYSFLFLFSLLRFSAAGHSRLVPNSDSECYNIMISDQSSPTASDGSEIILVCDIDNDIHFLPCLIIYNLWSGLGSDWKLVRPTLQKSSKHISYSDPVRVQYLEYLQRQMWRLLLNVHVDTKIHWTTDCCLTVESSHVLPAAKGRW